MMNEQGTSVVHTDKIRVRRKRLFATENLVPVLHSNDSNSNFSDIHVLDSEDDNEKFIDIFKPRLKEYDIFNEDMLCHTPAEIRSSLDSLDISFSLSSPASSIAAPDSVVPTFEKSPTSKLKTPHDTSTVKINFKQQKRKAACDLEESGDTEMIKENKVMKLDDSAIKSKARTALFAELPVTSFYPKSDNLPVKSFYSRIKNNQEFLKRNLATKSSKTRKSYPSRKKTFGQINSGVRHKIRKPKERKIKKAVPLISVINVLQQKDTSGYLNVVAEFKEASAIKQIKKIEEKEKDPPIVQQVKQKPVENKRIFKTKRGVSDEDKNNIQTVPSPNLKKRKSFTDPYEDYGEFNIVNILATLKEDLSQENIDPMKNRDLILSPTSQMCDMTSGLKLNSPKRGKLNITKLLEQESCSTNDSSFVDLEQQKLFPIFYPNVRKENTVAQESNAQPVAKKLKKLPENQMLLDAGQKKFGVTECHECAVVYHMGDPNDELRHMNYHNGRNLLKFNQWKNEHVVADFLHSRIIKVVPGDSKIWWKKVKDLVEFANRDLGCFDKDIIDDTKNQVFLYIKNKQVVGCLVACSKTVGYKMLPSEGMDINMCSEESYPIKCGVSRIWVSRMYRKQGIATAMMNALSKNFMYGHFLQPFDIAISAPTENGMLFARKYFKTDQFLIYLS